MSDLSLPESSAGLDAAWLTKALRAGGLDTDGVITGFEAEVLGDAVGLMGEVVRLTLDWDPPDPTLPSSVVAKLPSTLEENRALGLSLGLYEAEHRFYGELSQAAAIRTPRCWFTGGDPGKGRYALGSATLGSCHRCRLPAGRRSRSHS